MFVSKSSRLERVSNNINELVSRHECCVVSDVVVGLIRNMANFAFLWIYVESNRYPKRYPNRVLMEGNRRMYGLTANKRITPSLIVHATRDHKCDVCQKAFTTRQHLKQHAQGHTGELACPFCNKTFKWKHSLTEHIRAHKGKRRVFKLLKLSIWF